MWYLLYFLHRLLDYRLPEIQALAHVFAEQDDEEEEKERRRRRREGDDTAHQSPQHRQRLPVRFKQPSLHHPDSPFYFVDLPSEDMAFNIASRSFLLKGVMEVWGFGESAEELCASIRSYPRERMDPYLSAGTTFKIAVECFGKALSHREQTERMNSLDYIAFEGKVDLKKPQHVFWYLESNKEIINNGLPPVTQKLIMFGRKIGNSERNLITKYELSKRNYLGPTAMDAELAFLMANQALVRPGKFVFDPFVGTGSILVAAAHFGAITIGADIDLKVVRDGHGPNRNVWSNFKQYDLPAPVGLIRADNNSPPWRSNLKEVFDAIICDPPYGVRAGGRKSGGRKLLKGDKEPYIIPEDKRKDHIPSTAPYMFSECVHDLMDISARLLVLGGRLVFFFPVSRDECYEDIYPKHDCFKLISSSEQILSTRWSRCLLTMEKIRSYTDEMAAEAALKHQEFRERHAELLEERDLSLHSLVFSPTDHCNGNKQDPRPKYRGKHV